MRQVIIQIEAEKENMVDTLWYEQRDDSKQDEKNHEAKFCKEIGTFFRKIEPVGQNLSQATAFPVAAQALDLHPNKF